MTISLSEQVVAIQRHLAGTDSFLISSPHHLKITAGDTEILNEKVPNNKKWRVILEVKIEEADENIEI